MQTYRFDRHVAQSHTITLELPPEAPTGPAQIIVSFPEAPRTKADNSPRFADIAEYIAWLDTQPPTGRTREEIDRQVQEEHDSWSD